MSYPKGLGNSVWSQGGFKKWPIFVAGPLTLNAYSGIRVYGYFVLLMSKYFPFNIGISIFIPMLKNKMQQIPK